ncbi:hypothetical protein OSB04_024927 [Centaurea solstitialis]|uniref:Reverse transcriptase domain-containing protein n=1 Tax=Centaurea solstitialis TaxID=347529 RepID=A0AA38SM29_9ASTR|nr:hypothetical protein OSB04_024927 [Centaurea solstitialis]
MAGVGTTNRQSVFSRISKPNFDARLNIPIGVKNNMDFAAVVGDNSTSNALQFFPLKDKAQSRIELPIELAKKVVADYHTTLYGYFLGPRVPYAIVQRCVKAAWGKFGFADMMMNANGFYFFKFNNLGGSKQVIESGPLMVRGVPLFISEWDPTKGITKPIHTSCPLWVKLHNIPLVAFNVEGISRIASALGVPKQMDACTASMCDKAWGRPGFAKVLIETWAVGELKRELEVVIPNLNGGAEVPVTINVEYLWEPIQCSTCLVFGHKASTCSKNKVIEVPPQKHKEVDADGFIRVTRKEWRKKSNVVDTSIQKEAVPSDSDGSTSLQKNDHDEEVSEMEQVSTETIVREQEQVVQPEVVEVVVDKQDTSNSKGDRVVMDKEDVSGVSVIHNLMINIATWNIRGLNTRGKQIEVRDVIHENDVNICAIVESHVRVDMLDQVCNYTFGRWNWISNQASCDYGTRIILAWDGGIFDIMMLEMESQFMHCEVKVRGTDVAFFLTVLYGANRGVDRRRLWSGLRKFSAIFGQKPWAISGDFNALLFPHDALGGVSRRNADMAEFFSCVEDIEVFDLRYTGIQHTWCQKPKEEAGLKRKLDRVMANIAFTSSFSNASVKFLPRRLSDHSPSLLTFKGGVRRKKWGFKFDNFITENARFLPIVMECWKTNVEGSFMFRVTQKLKLLKQPLRHLRNSYGDLAVRTSKVKHELDVIQLAVDLDPFNDALKEDLKALRVAYQQARKNEEVSASQRAKVKWLREGDSNTRFFHMVVKEKRYAQQVHSIRNSCGVYVYDDEVPLSFVENLKFLLGTRDDSLDPIMPSKWFLNPLCLSDALHMIRPISDSDIRNAMFSIGNEKAPGSDGFTAKFFKASWSIVGGDVTTAIHNFFYRSKLDKELNHTLICLLPKTPNATCVTDFRPISCCTVLYKCISKILVDRIKPYLDGLISRSQSAFVPGRRIFDNILMAHELVVGYHLNSGAPRCAFKIDIRKSYDMVDWNFLLRARGIRQGDPLSPYLFTVIMEGFAMIFRNCIAEAASFGYHAGCEDLSITHLCFADDLFVFTRGDVASVGILKKALHLFASKSGLSPSIEKSEVFFGNVPMDEQHAILEYLPFKSGRKQLVTSVLQSLQLYWMAVFVFPSAVVHQIEALCRYFLWTQGESSRGKCKIAWDLVCRPLVGGGLGFKRLSVWNRALITKHIWDLRTKRNSLWVDWIHRHYLRNAEFWTVRSASKWSWVFRKIMSIREDVRRFLRVRIGNGRTTHAWEDTWLLDTPLSSLISYRVVHAMGFSVSSTVFDVLSVLEGVWPNVWVERYPQLAASSFLVYKPIWYGALGCRSKCVWFKGHIPKHSFCLWIACLKRHPTQDRIALWKHEPPDLVCSLCGAGSDSHLHLFFMCPFSSAVWSGICMKMDWYGFPNNWDAILLALSDPSTAPKHLAHKLTLAASVYMLWCERNHHLFSNQKKSEVVIINEIRDVV